jgi:hypothetical protein
MGNRGAGGEHHRSGSGGGFGGRGGSRGAPGGGHGGFGGGSGGGFGGGPGGGFGGQRGGGSGFDRGGAQGPEGGARRGRGGPPSVDSIFKSWDKDGNGTISHEEFDARPRFGGGDRRGAGASNGDHAPPSL